MAVESVSVALTVPSGTGTTAGPTEDDIVRSKLFAGAAIMIAIASLAACDDDESDNPVDDVDDTIESIVDDVTDNSEQPPTS